ncbi:MAG: transposase [Deltaproteobacteria bacterium]|nr:transposase [Deltaproteobacteria bacterium]
MAKRQRRKLTDEYKAEAVRLVREGGTSKRQISRDLDLTESSLRNWVKQVEIDSGKGPTGTLTTDELAGQSVAERRGSLFFTGIRLLECLEWRNAKLSKCLEEPFSAPL